MEFGPQDACKRRGLNITGGWEKSAIFLYSISSKIGEKSYSAAISHYWEGKKTHQTKKTPTPYTQKTQKIRTRYINTKCSETFVFANRGSAFSQACLQDLVSLANRNIWGVMVNKSIFKCTILKQKNISLLC